MSNQSKEAIKLCEEIIAVLDRMTSSYDRIDKKLDSCLDHIDAIESIVKDINPKSLEFSRGSV